MKNLVVFISCLIGISVLALGFLAASGEVKDLSTETYKAILQLVVIGIAGHVVSILITKSNLERQELLEKNEFRNSILTRLNTAFIEVKKLRRISRATALKRKEADKTHYFLDVSDYHNYMQAINEAQLQLEVIEKDISSNSILFTHRETITSNISKMEEYLNGIINEYEHTPLTIVSDPEGKLHTEKYEMFHDLINEYYGSKFRIEFVHSYYQSLEKVREDLVHIQPN
jgi:hypothetical protein